MHALVVGLGKSGVAAAQYLRGRGVRVSASEVTPRERLDASLLHRLADQGVEVECGGHSESLFTSVDLIVVSPGVPLEMAVLAAARVRGIPIAGELGLERFSMNLVIPSGAAGLNEDILVRYEQVAPVIERVIEKSLGEGVEFMWYSPTPLCMFNPIVHGLGNKGCSACDGLLSVDCNGDVLPCSSWPEPVGNLLKTGFTEIWDSKQAAACRMKSFAHQGCRLCDSFAVCHGACPLYWRHFGFSELECKGGLRRPGALFSGGESARELSATTTELSATATGMGV